MKNKAIEQLIVPLIEDLNYEFVGLEYQSAGANSLLRVYIDQPETGINVEDCAKISREISAILDVEDPIKSAYRLEVSSPGLDRPIFNIEQFERFKGREVSLTVLPPIDGRKRFKGIINATEDRTVILNVDDCDVRIQFANIQKARLVPVF
ncbi:MAG: ribosome maturation factor RimP [bacterium]